VWERVCILLLCFLVICEKIAQQSVIK